MFQVLIIILVYIVGPVAILAWAFKRYKHGIKPTFSEASIVIIAIVLMVIFAYFSTWKTTDHDNEEVAQIVTELTQRYDFPVKAKFQDRPAVNGVARPHRLEIHVYGILQRSEQDKVVEVLKKLRRQVASKPIVVHFIREEVWETDADGSRRPRRDREELLRKARID